MTARCAVLLAAVSLSAFAGSRPRPGGTLQLVLVSPSMTVDPSSADAPIDAFRLSLTHQPICRLVDMTRSPGVLKLTVPASVDVKFVTEALTRGAPLLTNVGAPNVNGREVELPIRGARTDLERTLCHPLFSLPVGPFKVKGTRLEAFDEQPMGRPYLDGLALQATDARTAERLFAQRRAQLVVGASTPTDAPQLFVTALALGPGLANVRTAIESSIDRADLARFFVPAPSAALPSLQPGATPTTPTPARPSPVTPAQELTLSFDQTAEHERGIAQRLQVKLQPFGYRVALKPVPRAEVKARAPGANELVLRSFALPPSPTGALLMWLSVAGQQARAAAVLQSISSAPDADARARDLSLQLANELNVIPLVTRGLGVSATRDVQHLTRDAMGLPRVDDAFFSAE
ncbi:MAG: hypothetical protein DI536_27180 [Archangium gephyra]|uniref:Uncharacterized protein n=1 Tax=Archangium gephyra TaxID=48 RepID=A0A2W5T5N8_9BACT|nr:MAG: hypothetical protein DI536_27180 [Archangium gephyra]